MKTTVENAQEPQKETVQRVQQEPSNGGSATITDNRPATVTQRKLRSAMGGAEDTTNPIQRKNNTGLPNNLKSGIENLSGYSMDDVKVHYNSSKPAQLQAHAYAQGTDIHLGAGQEKHLPHEAWHVVQQKQGRVKPTMQFKGKVNINDNVGLEREADVMGAKASNADKEKSTSNNLIINKQKSYLRESEKTTQRIEDNSNLLLIKYLSKFAGINLENFTADEENRDILYISTVSFDIKELPFVLKNLTLNIHENSIRIEVGSGSINDGQLLLEDIDITLSGNSTVWREMGKLLFPFLGSAALLPSALALPGFLALSLGPFLVLHFLSLLALPTLIPYLQTKLFGKINMGDLINDARIKIDKVSIPELVIGKDRKVLNLSIKNFNVYSGITDIDNKLAILLSFLEKSSNKIVKLITVFLEANVVDENELTQLLLEFFVDEGLNISFSELELKISDGITEKNSDVEGVTDEIEKVSEQFLKIEGFEVGVINDERKMHIPAIYGAMKDIPFTLGPLTMTLGENTSEIDIKQIFVNTNSTQFRINGIKILLNGDTTVMTQVWTYLVPFLVAKLSGREIVIPIELNDLLESVSIDIKSISISPKQTNFENTVKKITKLDIKDLKLIASSMNKLPVLLAFLAKHSQAFVETIESVTGVSGFEEGNPIELLTDLLGDNGIGLTIGELKQEIIEGSEAKRYGKGGYTGPKGELQTHNMQHGTNILTNFSVAINKDADNDNQLITDIKFDKFEKDIKKEYKVKNGKSKEKTKRDHLIVENLEAKIIKKREGFEVIESELDLKKDGNHISISNLGAVLNDSVTGHISLKIKIRRFKLYPNFTLTIQVNEGIIDLTKVEKDIKQGLSKNHLKSLLVSPILWIIRSRLGDYISKIPKFNYRDAGVLRRTFEVFNPDIADTERDVVDLKSKNKKEVTHINLKNIFNYHSRSSDRYIHGRRLVSVPGDGHCLFSALNHHLNVVDGVQSLRQDVVDFTDDPVNAGYVAQVYASTNNYPQRLRDMSNMNDDIIWGGDEEIRILSRIHNVPIIIHGSGEFVQVFPADGGILYLANVDNIPNLPRAIHIYYTGAHYDALE